MRSGWCFAKHSGFLRIYEIYERALHVMLLSTVCIKHRKNVTYTN
jgi:hypothetical protein